MQDPQVVDDNRRIHFEKVIQGLFFHDTQKYAKFLVLCEDNPLVCNINMSLHVKYKNNTIPSSAIFMSILNNRMDILDILLTVSSLNVNAKQTMPHDQSVRCSPLHFAIKIQRISFVEKLLESGGNPLITSEGPLELTPLFTQISIADNKLVVEKLVHAGANLATRNKNGDTALDFAIAKQRAQSVAVLLEMGAGMFQELPDALCELGINWHNQYCFFDSTNAPKNSVSDLKTICKTILPSAPLEQLALEPNHQQALKFLNILTVFEDRVPTFTNFMLQNIILRDEQIHIPPHLQLPEKFHSMSLNKYQRNLTGTIEQLTKVDQEIKYTDCHENFMIAGVIAPLVLLLLVYIWGLVAYLENGSIKLPLSATLALYLLIELDGYKYQALSKRHHQIASCLLNKLDAINQPWCQSLTKEIQQHNEPINWRNFSFWMRSVNQQTLSNTTTKTLQKFRGHELALKNIHPGNLQEEALWDEQAFINDELEKKRKTL